MSIRMVGALMALSAIAPAATAQSIPTGPQVTAEQAVETARRVYGPPPPDPEQRADCAEPEGDEIVVCAQLEEQSQFRVESSLDRNDDSKMKWMGDPPDVSGPGIFKGPATASGCIPGLTCPPPPVYLIDFDALPEAPPGSDADRIAKGEIPAP